MPTRRWQLAEDDRDEFPKLDGGRFWYGSIVAAQRRAATQPPEALAVELLKRPKQDFWYEDEWADICRAKPATSDSHAAAARKGWRVAVGSMADGAASVR